MAIGADPQASTIAELSSLTAEIPLPDPLQVGKYVITSREYCCVRVTLSSGATGEAFVLTRGLDIGNSIERLVGLRVFEATPEEAYNKLRVSLRNVGWDGPISRAASAVLLAAFDALGHEKSEPVWRLLGGSRAPRTEVVAAIGYTRVGEAPGSKELLEAEAALAAGVSTVKVMGGFDAPAADIERIERIRSAVPNVAVGIDLNGAWSVDAAIDAMPRLIDAGVAFVEEPLPYELGLAQLLRLTQAVNTPPVAAGEVSASSIELEMLTQLAGIDYVRADATLLGGPTPFGVVQQAAIAQGVSVFPHFWPEVHIHLMGATEKGGLLEVALPGSGGFGLERFVDGLARIDNGHVQASEQPGFGYRLDWTQLETLAERPIVTLSPESRPSAYRPKSR